MLSDASAKFACEGSSCFHKLNRLSRCVFSFPNLGIQHVTKKSVKTVLRDRYLKQHVDSSIMAANNGGGTQPFTFGVDSKTEGLSNEAIAQAVTGNFDHSILPSECATWLLVMQSSSN